MRRLGRCLHVFTICALLCPPAARAIEARRACQNLLAHLPGGAAVSKRLDAASTALYMASRARKTRHNAARMNFEPEPISPARLRQLGVNAEVYEANQRLALAYQIPYRVLTRDTVLYSIEDGGFGKRLYVRGSGVFLTEDGLVEGFSPAFPRR